MNTYIDELIGTFKYENVHFVYFNKILNKLEDLDVAENKDRYLDYVNNAKHLYSITVHDTDIKYIVDSECENCAIEDVFTIVGHRCMVYSHQII